MEQRGIKESMEFLDGVEVLGVTAKKVMADGKISAADLPHAVSLVGQAGTLVKAADGVEDIVKEAKDYSAEELQQIGAKVIAVIAKIKAA